MIPSVCYAPLLVVLCFFILRHVVDRVLRWAFVEQSLITADEFYNVLDTWLSPPKDDHNLFISIDIEHQPLLTCFKWLLRNGLRKLHYLAYVRMRKNVVPSRDASALQNFVDFSQYVDFDLKYQKDQQQALEQQQLHNQHESYEKYQQQHQLPEQYQQNQQQHELQHNEQQSEQQHKPCHLPLLHPYTIRRQTFVAIRHGASGFNEAKKKLHTQSGFMKVLNKALNKLSHLVYEITHFFSHQNLFDTRLSTKGVWQSFKLQHFIQAHYNCDEQQQQQQQESDKNNNFNITEYHHHQNITPSASSSLSPLQPTPPNNTIDMAFCQSVLDKTGHINLFPYYYNHCAKRHINPETHELELPQQKVHGEYHYHNIEHNNNNHLNNTNDNNNKPSFLKNAPTATPTTAQTTRKQQLLDILNLNNAANVQNTILFSSTHRRTMSTVSIALKHVLNRNTYYKIHIHNLLSAYNPTYKHTIPSFHGEDVGNVLPLMLRENNNSKTTSLTPQQQAEDLFDLRYHNGMTPLDVTGDPCHNLRHIVHFVEDLAHEQDKKHVVAAVHSTFLLFFLQMFLPRAVAAHGGAFSSAKKVACCTAVGFDLMHAQIDLRDFNRLYQHTTPHPHTPRHITTHPDGHQTVMVTMIDPYSLTELYGHF